MEKKKVQKRRKRVERFPFKKGSGRGFMTVTAEQRPKECEGAVCPLEKGPSGRKVHLGMAVPRGKVHQGKRAPWGGVPLGEGTLNTGSETGVCLLRF